MRLVRKKFVQWLKSNQDFVFERGDGTCCPIAAYLYGECEVDDLCVGRDEIDIGRRTIPTPLWAQHFIFEWDHGSGESTGKQALELL